MASSGDKPAYKPLLAKSTRIKVSSTLDKTVSKKHLADANPETCWSSQQGFPQFIHVFFDDDDLGPVIPRELRLTFQGGFVGIECTISVLYDHTGTDNEQEQEDKLTPSTLIPLTIVYPEDVNRKQSFHLPDITYPIRQIKLTFEQSSDFFGRVTVYDLQLLGLLASDTRQN